MICLGVIGYGSRIHGMINSNFRAVDPDLRITAIVDPDEKSVRQRLPACDQEAVFYPDLKTMMQRAKLDALAIGTRGDIQLARDFIDLIRGQIKVSRTPIATGIQSIYACLAARESVQKGRFVEVRQAGL